MQTELVESERLAVDPLVRSTRKAAREGMRRAGVTEWRAPQAPKLLRWLQWSRMLGVSVESLVCALARHYRTVLDVRGTSLGVRPSVLLGPAALRWAESALHRNPVRAPIEGIDQLSYGDRMRRHQRAAVTGARTWRLGPAWTGAEVRQERSRRDGVSRQFGLERVAGGG